MYVCKVISLKVDSWEGTWGIDILLLNIGDSVFG